MANGRIGDWQQTYTGKQVWPLDLRPEEICLEDIAHSLALQCRYNGHIKSFFSVAQHSVLVAQGLRDQGHDVGIQCIGLLHDAAEAYLGDMIRPLKRSGFMHEFLQAKHRAELVIGEVFGLVLTPMLAAVKDMDNIVLLTEKRDLLAPPPVPWTERGYVPLAATIYPLMPASAEADFWVEAKRLGIKGA